MRTKLGCPVIVVLKAIENGCYYDFDTDNCGIPIHAKGISKPQLDEYDGEFLLDNGLIILHTKDYKKTWWLKEDKSE